MFWLIYGKFDIICFVRFITFRSIFAQIVGQNYLHSRQLLRAITFNVYQMVRHQKYKNFDSKCSGFLLRILFGMKQESIKETER